MDPLAVYVVYVIHMFQLSVAISLVSFCLLLYIDLKPQFIEASTTYVKLNFVWYLHNCNFLILPNSNFRLPVMFTGKKTIYSNFANEALKYADMMFIIQTKKIC